MIYESLPSIENGNWCKFRLTMSASQEQLALVEDVVFDVHPSMGQWRFSGVISEKSTSTQQVSDDRDTNVANWKTMGTKVTLKSGTVVNFPPIQIDCQAPQALKSGKHSYALSFETDSSVSQSQLDQVLDAAAGGFACALEGYSLVRFRSEVNANKFMSKVLDLSSGSIRITGINYVGDAAVLSCGDSSPAGLKN